MESESGLLARQWCRGVARVKLSALNFESSMRQGHRPPSEEVIELLQRKFKIAGCHRFDEQSYISAVVDDAALDDALSAVGLAKTELTDPTRGIPHLSLPPLQCLHGLHRVLAARRYLGEDGWWTVRLYSSGEKVNTGSPLALANALCRSPKLFTSANH